MRIAIIVAVFLVSAGLSGLAVAQTVEMAAQCDKAEKQLAELIKKPDSTDARKIKEALGLDILDSCSSPKGDIICYQCVDKDQKLRTLQLLQNRETKRFELLGFGCRCRDEK
ncbi:MAG: hypothetical protein HY914_22325 [Desulfomonile tiedjei]|nr:hypothetical protein [Desulfomonile tiedjei]